MVGVLGGSLYVLANHSFTETRLRCDAVAGPIATIFARIELYRPWVGLWSESNGNAWIEAEQGFYHYFSELDANEFYVQMLLTQ